MGHLQRVPLGGLRRSGVQGHIRGFALGRHLLQWGRSIDAAEITVAFHESASAAG